MIMLNRWQGIGRLTADPELKYTPNGHAVCNYSIAVEDGYGDNRDTQFIDIVLWRKKAETDANQLRKGDLIYVEGRLVIRSYENNEGRKVYVTEVVANETKYLFWGKMRDNNGQGGNNQQSAEEDIEVPF